MSSTRTRLTSRSESQLTFHMSSSFLTSLHCRLVLQGSHQASPSSPSRDADRDRPSASSPRQRVQGRELPPPGGRLCRAVRILLHGQSTLIGPATVVGCVQARLSGRAHASTCPSPLHRSRRSTTQDPIQHKLSLILLMSLIIVWGGRLPVVRIARIAGAFSVPTWRLRAEVCDVDRACRHVHLLTAILFRLSHHRTVR
jgi:hypothetical protein